MEPLCERTNLITRHGQELMGLLIRALGCIAILERDDNRLGMLACIRRDSSRCLCDSALPLRKYDQLCHARFFCSHDIWAM